MKSTHNASTFKPYDPAETLGDTAPTAAKPPKKNKCGAFGQVLLVVIAVAVATITQQHWLTPHLLSGTFGAAAGVASGAAAGAAGSIASQAVGVATGIQEKFSWNGVALAAIGGGVGGGMGLKSYSGWGQAAANAAGQSIVSQGIGMALGLQSKFSWAGVAAAGVSGGIGYKVGKGVEGRFGEGKVAAAATTATVATASSIAHAATRSAIEGSNFGDNIRASIPDIIGQAMGGLLADTFGERVDSLTRNDRISAADQRASRALAASMDSQSGDLVPNGMGALSMGASTSDDMVVALPGSTLSSGAPDSEATLQLGRVTTYGQNYLNDKSERQASALARLDWSMAAGALRAEQRALKPAPQLVGRDPNTGGHMFHTPIDPLSDEWMSLRGAQARELGFLSEKAPYDPLSLHTLVGPDGAMSLWVPQANPLKEGQLLFSPVVDPAEAQLYIQLTETFGAAAGWLRMPNVRPTAWFSGNASGAGARGTGFVRFADDVDAHIVARDFGVPRRNGIGGAHNLDEFMKHSGEFKILSSTPHPSFPGISKIEYRMYQLDRSGNMTTTLQSGTRTKTVYDPKAISDTDIQVWGRQAAAQAQSAGPLAREWTGIAPNGLAFRGYLDQTGAVRSYFPDF